MDNNRENFCGACLAIPFAFAGAGASAYGANSKKKHKKTKKIVFWVGIITTVIALIIAAYYLWFKKDCSDCE